MLSPYDEYQMPNPRMRNTMFRGLPNIQQKPVVRQEPTPIILPPPSTGPPETGLPKWEDTQKKWGGVFNRGPAAQTPGIVPPMHEGSQFAQSVGAATDAAQPGNGKSILGA